jgi:hypothetical protein
MERLDIWLMKKGGHTGLWIGLSSHPLSSPQKGHLRKFKKCMVS